MVRWLGEPWHPYSIDPTCPVCGGYCGLDGREPVCRCGTSGRPTVEELVGCLPVDVAAVIPTQTRGSSSGTG